MSDVSRLQGGEERLAQGTHLADAGPCGCMIFPAFPAALTRQQRKWPLTG